MKQLIFHILFLAMLSCNTGDEKAKIPLNVEIGDFSKSIDFQCQPQEIKSPTSNLKQLASKLSSLENNYQIKSIEKGEPTKSILVSRLKYYSVNNIMKGGKVIYKITNFGSFAKSIAAINFCQVKGTKDLSKNLYARAKIEEIIFNSADCAQNAFEEIEKLQNRKRVWEDINKAPSSVFKIDNRIYYVSSAGHYMMEFYKEIAAQMIAD